MLGPWWLTRMYCIEVIRFNIHESPLFRFNSFRIINKTPVKSNSKNDDSCVILTVRCRVKEIWQKWGKYKYCPPCPRRNLCLVTNEPPLKIRSGVNLILKVTVTDPIPEEEYLKWTQRPGAVDAAVEPCAVHRMAEEPLPAAEGGRQREGLRPRTLSQQQQQKRGGECDDPRWVNSTPRKSWHYVHL